MPKPTPEREPSVTLAVAVQRLTVDARNWLAAEAQLTRMEVHAAVRRAFLACAAGIVALLLAMITLFIAAQTTVQALAAHAGGLVPAGLIVTIILLVFTATAAALSRTLAVRRRPAESVVFRWIGGHRLRD